MQNFKNTIITLSLAITTCASLAACGGGLDAGNSDRELALEAGESGDFPIAEGEASTLVITNNIGKITLTGGSDSTNVSVSTEQGPDYDALADEGILVVTWLEGDQLVVQVEGPDGSEQAVDIEIEAPTDLTVAIRGDEHTVSVSGMRGTGAVNTTDGDIRFDDYQGGSLALDASGGDISFSASDFGYSRVAMTSQDGDIDVTLPADAAFTLAATSSSGSATVSGFDVPAFGGFAGGDVNGGGGRVVAYTTGNVSVSAD